jgi:hypothetical protein
MIEVLVVKESIKNWADVTLQRELGRAARLYSKKKKKKKN